MALDILILASCHSLLGGKTIMRIKIKLGGEEKDIEVFTKKKEEDSYLDKIVELKKRSEKDDDSIASVKEFVEFENEMAINCSTLSKEEYDDLYSEDRNKIKRAIRNMIFPHSSGDPANFF